MDVIIIYFVAQVTQFWPLAIPPGLFYCVFPCSIFFIQHNSYLKWNSRPFLCYFFLLLPADILCFQKPLIFIWERLSSLALRCLTTLGYSISALNHSTWSNLKTSFLLNLQEGVLLALPCLIRKPVFSHNQLCHSHHPFALSFCSWILHFVHNTL